MTGGSSGSTSRATVARRVREGGYASLAACENRARKTLFCCLNLSEIPIHYLEARHGSLNRR